MTMLGTLPPTAKPIDLSPAEAQAWTDYFRAFADQLDLANALAQNWYDSMRQVFEDLGVPMFQAAASQEGMPLAWTKELDQTYLDVQDMVQQSAVWLREAADGKRHAILQGDQWSIESLPGDPYRIEVNPQTNQPIMVEAGGNEIHQTDPSVNGVGAVPWVIVGIGLIAGVAVTALRAYVLYHLITGITGILQSIAQYQNAKVWSECVQKASNTDACLRAQQGLVDLTKAQNEGRSKLSDDLAGLASVLKVVFGGAAILGAGYLVYTFVPPLLAEHKRRAEAT